MLSIDLVDSYKQILNINVREYRRDNRKRGKSRETGNIGC
jgi:hypothetical protein